MRMQLPYDKKRIAVDIDDQNFVGSLVSARLAVASPRLLVSTWRRPAYGTRPSGGRYCPSANGSTKDEYNKARRRPSSNSSQSLGAI
jgi:hypothetical protein